MKRSVLIALSIWLTVFCLKGEAPDVTRHLHWEDHLRFEGSYFPDSLSLPWYSESLRTSPQADGIALRFPVFEPLTPAQAKTLTGLHGLESLGEDLQLGLRRSQDRKATVWDVKLIPLVRRNGRYYRLVSFEWDIHDTPSKAMKACAAQASLPTFASGKADNDPSRYAAHSRLSEGRWVRVSVTQDGFYRIPYEQLRRWGFDPAKAQVYGYGGYLLDEDFRRPYTDDLPLVPVYRDESSQHIVFFAQGLTRWMYDESRDIYLAQTNHYATKACYFIGQRAEGSLEATRREAIESPATAETDRYTDFLLHEVELVNPGATGRRCFGEDFSTQTKQTFSFSLGPNVLTDEPSRIAVDFAARNTVNSACLVYQNQQSLGRMSFASVKVNDSYTYGRLGTLTSDFYPSGQEEHFRLEYMGASGMLKMARLDFIALNVRKRLALQEGQLLFCDPVSVAPGQVVDYRVAGAGANTLVLDVTEGTTPCLVPAHVDEGDLVFRAEASSLRRYALLDPSTVSRLPQPKREADVPCQDLHGEGPVDYVVIAHPDFLDLAGQLAQAHRDKDGLRCLVVSSQQIYNEFSSGTPDATAYRRFMKMFYDRAETDEDLPSSLLLFGDGVYDNRMITTAFASVKSIPNRLLTYESVETLDGTASYVSDDYFGLLDDSEGYDIAAGKMDIGVGRLPVRTLAEAETVVRKILSYMDNTDKGTWKNTLCFLGDDGDNNLHTTHADRLAQTVATQRPEFIVNKIYVDAYPRVTTASGQTVPAANQRFAQLLSSGLLMLNYSGHGSTTAWAVESLLSIQEIRNMKNSRLPLWVTATCDFCRYDDSETSGGELVFLNENGGASAMITTSRAVYSTPNFTLNKALVETLYGKQQADASLGEVLRLTKRSNGLLYDGNKLNFTLIGDPAMKLAYPRYEARVTRLNGREIQDGQPDTLSALQEVWVEGAVYRPDGQVAEDYDGVLCPTVFDAKETAHTLGNNGNDIFTYERRDNTLYSGKASVSKGRFSFRFLIPKDLSYSYQSGLINLYAYRHEGEGEAQGVFEGFVLGGSAVEDSQDQEGPAIRLWMNDTTFTEGGKTGLNPSLVASLSDPSGLNTSGNSVGHDLVLTLDGKERFILNNYYESDLDSYTSGHVYYPLSDLEPGEHTLSLRAWDMLNHSSTASLSFVVDATWKPSLLSVQAIREGNRVRLVYEHNQPRIWNKVQADIYDSMGRLCWTAVQQGVPHDNQGSGFTWDFADAQGRPLPGGLYLCRLTLQTESGGVATGSCRILAPVQ